MGDKKEAVTRRNDLSVVAQDQNWRSTIKNELKNAEQWDADWGFLANHGKESEGKLQLFWGRVWGVLRSRRFEFCNAYLKKWGGVMVSGVI